MHPMDTCNATPSAPIVGESHLARYGIELTVTGYPPAAKGDQLLSAEGQSWAKLAGPWHEQLDVSTGYAATYQEFAMALHGAPQEQIRVQLENVRYAQPGWLAGRMRLVSAHGEELGAQRPFVLYAREASIATYTYFTDTHPAIDGAFSVGLRVTREP
jgi:hypothetical protein